MGDLHELPSVGRVLFLDERRGAALRATWHLERGLVNLSIWSGNECTETFQLSIQDASRLVSFLVDGMARATQALIHREMEAPIGAPPGFVTRVSALLRRLTA